MRAEVGNGSNRPGGRGVGAPAAAVEAQQPRAPHAFGTRAELEARGPGNSSRGM